MSETLTKIVVDCSTGETEILPLSAEEIKQYEKDQIAFKAHRDKLEAKIKAETEAKVSAVAKLSALGLTEDEAKFIVG